MHNLFVTGIGTEVGKTIVSAILVEALEGDYWKPIQAGDLDNSDSKKIKSLISNKKTKIYSETYKLNFPMSPHAAARRDNILINFKEIQIPDHKSPLIIEGAGGLMVPLNDHQLMIDLIRYLSTPVILVSRNYLGSINHTLLSILAIKHFGLSIMGIFFNGPENKDTQQIILQQTQIPCLGNLYEEKQITPEIIKKYAEKWKPKLYDILL